MTIQTPNEIAKLDDTLWWNCACSCKIHHQTAMWLLRCWFLGWCDAVPKVLLTGTTNKLCIQQQSCLDVSPSLLMIWSDEFSVLSHLSINLISDNITLERKIRRLLKIHRVWMCKMNANNKSTQSTQSQIFQCVKILWIICVKWMQIKNILFLQISQPNCNVGGCWGVALWLLRCWFLAWCYAVARVARLLGLLTGTTNILCIQQNQLLRCCSFIAHEMEFSVVSCLSINLVSKNTLDS